MRRLFADAFSWIALLHAADQWHQRVIAFTAMLPTPHLYTTDAVFDEYPATYSARGALLCQRAAATMRRLLASPKGAAMEKVGAGALADQALQTLMRLHVQKYARHIADVQRELAPFEQWYGLSSAECYRRFMAGEMGDSADIMEWMGLYEDVLLSQERIATLRAATEV